MTFCRPGRMPGLRVELAVLKFHGQPSIAFAPVTLNTPGGLGGERVHAKILIHRSQVGPNQSPSPFPPLSSDYSIHFSLTSVLPNVGHDGHEGEP